MGGATTGGPTSRPETVPAVPPPPPPSSTKPLDQLSVDELEGWLASINLSHLAPKLKRHNVTAEVLSLIECARELEQYGLSTGHARLLMRRIEEVSVVGVRLTAIAPPQIPPPAPLRPSSPAPSSAVPVCVAVPHLLRPSDEEFIHYAKEGKTEQVREALQYYPDLISVRDNAVGAL
eukprot:gene36822-biopygen28965